MAYRSKKKSAPEAKGLRHSGPGSPLRLEDGTRLMWGESEDGGRASQLIA